MHSTTYKIPGFFGRVLVHHNSDWSGEATICYQEEPIQAAVGNYQEVQVPAKLLVAIGQSVALDYLRNTVTDVLDNLEEDFEVVRQEKAFPRQGPAAETCQYYDGYFWCGLRPGHEGRHQTRHGQLLGPQKCGAAMEDSRCALPVGHGGTHLTANSIAYRQFRVDHL